MPMDRFMIAPFNQNSGLQNNMKPWMIPDTAFESLQNAYVWRGRIRKRFGSYLMNNSVNNNVAQLNSRLRYNIASTTSEGNFSGTLPAYAYAIGQMFSVGTEMFTIVTANGAMLDTGSATTKTFNISTYVINLAGVAASASIYWYPMLPVMGLLSYESSTLEQPQIIGFDTTFAYTYENGGWSQISTNTWSGSNSDFFWGCTYRGIQSSDTYFFIANYVVADGIRYYDGTSVTNLFIPINAIFSAGSPNVVNTGGYDHVLTAQIVLPFKGRLILLNTIETFGASNFSNGTPTPHVNRCRFSQVGTPITTITSISGGQIQQPYAESMNAWIQAPQFYGRGGFVDAPTKESIITAYILKDRCIVYFEKSTYELVYTNNPNIPFVWQQINSQLGAESTFSVVPFDQVVLGVGNVGIHSCNGANVQRIDDVIPEEVFKIHNGNDGIYRVYGIRDYFAETVYWTFPAAYDNPTYPNRVIVYNYITGAWAYNDDSITCFGYFNTPNDVTWQDANFTWAEAGSRVWNDAAFQSGFQAVIAGNQQGFVFTLDIDEPRNSPSLYISNMAQSGKFITITCPSHNLQSGQYVLIENCQGSTNLNGNIYAVQSIGTSGGITTFNIFGTLVGTYTGAGTVALVSDIYIQTKQYNPYSSQGKNVFIEKVDFLVDKTDYGQLEVDFTTSFSDLDQTLAAVPGVLTGTNILETSPYQYLYPMEQFQSQLWHPLYFNAEGEVIQFELYLNATQMVNPKIALAPFQLHAFTLYAQPTGRLQ